MVVSPLSAPPSALKGCPHPPSVVSLFLIYELGGVLHCPLHAGCSSDERSGKIISHAAFTYHWEGGFAHNVWYSTVLCIPLQ